MSPEKYRQTMTATRIMLFVAGILVFAVGFSLYILTAQADRYFAWTVSSLLTAAFLGGFYWRTAVLESLSARERLWVNSRLRLRAVMASLITFALLQLLALFRYGIETNWASQSSWLYLLTLLLLGLIGLHELLQSRSR